DRKANRVIERLIQVWAPEIRHLPDIQRDVPKNHAVFLIYANRSGLEMKIGIWRIMCRKGPVLYQVSVLGDLADILTTQEIRLRLRSHVCRANPFRIDVINAAIGTVERNL